MGQEADKLVSLRPVEGVSAIPEDRPDRLERARRLWEAMNGETPSLPADPALGELIADAVHSLGSGKNKLQKVITELGRDLPEPVASIDPTTTQIEPDRCGGFRVSGQPITVKSNQSFIYIDRPLGSCTELATDNASGAPALAVALVGHVHYRSGMPVRLKVAGEGGATLIELGLGAEWLLSSPSVRTLRLTPGRSRCIILIVAERRFAIYCDGVQVANGPVEREEAWRRLTLSVAPLLAPSGDMMLYHISAWALSNAEAAALSARLDDPGSHVAKALLDTPLTEQAAASFARLCHNMERLEIKFDDEQLDWVKRAAADFVDRNLDYHVTDVASKLPVAGALEVTRQAERAHGAAVVAVKDLTVELAHNPARDRRLHRLLNYSKQKTFRAVDQVNFELHKGDVLGIIGHNGAGKSTLLRALCGLIDISVGRIEIANRFLLLRPGIGMRDELTGRENIASMAFYLGLGLNEVNAMSDDIITFSELGEHIDKPVKYYSDGMRARLVFSIATSFAPEVLFLDELLSAGDIAFQEKAQARLRSFLNKVDTVVVVTHSTDFVMQSCTKGLLMHHGQQVYFGDPEEAVARYLRLLEG